MSFVIVTAADDYYMPLALDFLRSVRRLNPSVAFDIGLLDVGLNEDSKKQLAPFGVTIKPTKIDIDYPGRAAWEKQAPFFRAMTARPFLPDYFPGYDSYMWMDADSWAQTPEAIETMLAAAANDDAFYVAIEFDRDYPIIRQGRTLWQLHEKWYRSNFPAYLAEEMLLRPMLNCGIWAAAPGAPLWKKWAAVLTHTLQRIPEMKRENFMTEQLCMNVAAYLDQAPFKTIPAEYNWMTLFSVPLWDATRKLYVRSSLPHTPISVLHLNHQGKLKDAEIPCADGSMLQRPLTFSAWLEAQGNG